MKIGIDLTFLRAEYDGGKEQVAFNLLDGFHGLGLGSEMTIFIYSHSYDRIRTLIPDAKIKVIENTFSLFIKKKSIADMLLRTFKLPKLVKEERLDILFFPFYYTGLSKFSIPTIVLPHDVQFKEAPKRFGLKAFIFDSIFYYFDFKLRNKIIAISNYDAFIIGKYYPGFMKKIHVIYNPIKFIKINKADMISNNQAEPYIMSINIGFSHKNVITLIKAFELVKEQIPHNLVLVGRLRKSTYFLERYVKENGLQDRVFFTGFVSEEELQRLFCNCCLYVTPSLYEGFGMTPVEAMGMGIPVISSKETALPEATKNLANYYEPPEDTNALADQIRQVLHNGLDEKELEAIRNKMTQSYDYRTIAQQYYDFFTDVYDDQHNPN